MKLKFILIAIMLLVFSACTGSYDFEENNFDGNSINLSANVQTDDLNIDGNVIVSKKLKNDYYYVDENGDYQIVEDAFPKIIGDYELVSKHIEVADEGVGINLRYNYKYVDYTEDLEIVLVDINNSDSFEEMYEELEDGEWTTYLGRKVIQITKKTIAWIPKNDVFDFIGVEFNYDLQLNNITQKQALNYFIIQECPVNKEKMDKIEVEVPQESFETLALGEGEAVKYTLAGNVYNIELNKLDDFSAILIINGVNHSFNLYEQYKINNMYIRVVDIMTSNRVGIKGYAQFELSSFPTSKPQNGECGLYENEDGTSGIYTFLNGGLAFENNQCLENNTLERYECVDDSFDFERQVVECANGCSRGECLEDYSCKDALSSRISLGEGETRTVSLGGKTYTISLQAVNEDKVLITVNGYTTSIDECEIENVVGLNLQLTDVVVSSRPSVNSYAELGYGGVDEYSITVLDFITTPSSPIDAGQNIITSVTLFNNGENDVENVKFILTIPELNLEKTVYISDFNTGDMKTTDDMSLYIPTFASGLYMVVMTAFLDDSYIVTSYDSIYVTPINTTTSSSSSGGGGSSGGGVIPISFAQTDSFDFWEDQSSHNYEVEGYTASGAYRCSGTSVVNSVQNPNTDADYTLRLSNCAHGEGQVSLTLNVNTDADTIKLEIQEAIGDNDIGIIIDGIDFGVYKLDGPCARNELIFNNVEALTFDGEIEVTLYDGVPNSCAGDPQMSYLKVYS